MPISGGILLFLLAGGLLLLPRKLLKWYSALCLLLVTVYHWFMPRAGTLEFIFLNFKVELYQYRGISLLIGMVLSFFGFSYFLYIRSRKLSRMSYLLAFFHIGSALALLFVGDFLSFFIFWEFLTITAVGLILLDNSPAKLIRQYFLYHMAGSVLLFLGIAINYSQQGSMNLSSIPITYPATYLFFIPAIFIKAAVIPFHSWLTEAYSKVSTGLTVLLSAYATKIGAFSLLILTPLFDFEIMGALLALGAVAVALTRNNLRIFLSYHLISQIGYILAGFSGISGIAVVGGIYHLVNNVLYKGLLFMIAGILAAVLDSEEISGKGGWHVTRRYPLLFVVALIASASIAGLPPFNGYVSKKLITGGIESYPAMVLLKIATYGTALSFVKFIYNCFLKFEAGEELAGDNNFGPAKKVAVSLLSLACLIMGIFPRLFLSGTVAARESFYYLRPVGMSLLPALVAILLFVALFKKINFVLEQLAVDRVGFAYFLQPVWDFSLDKLQESHNGNLQHYIFWFFVFLLICWLYFYSQLGGFM